MDKKKEILRLVKYACISLFVTAIDFSVAYLCKFYLNFKLIVANSLGIICGSTTQYFLTNKYVFHVDAEKKTALIFFGSALLGLVINNLAITYVYKLVSNYFKEKIGLMISKAITAFFTFFVIYFTRKHLYKKYA